MHSHSQHGEDAVIIKLLGESAYAGGQLLDIGAWDPITFSNSRALIERGWDAVLVEPSPAPLRKLVETYGASPKVRVIGAAVALTPGLVELQVTDDAVTSSDPDVQNTWAKDGGYFGRLYSPGITVESILNQFGSFQFVNIDAEGMSFDLCLALLQTGMRPTVVCIEHDGRNVELMAHLQDEYIQEWINGTNLIVRRRP